MTRGHLLIAIAVVAALGFASVYAVGYMLSRPVPRLIGPPPSDFPAESVVIGNIRGWWAAAPGSRGAVLLLAGIRANRLDMLGRARFLRAAGYSVLLIDLQATGETPGEKITFGWRERLDVLAAVDFLRERTPGHPRAIIGASLGGVATVLASPRVDAVVLEAVYPSIEKATRNRLQMRLGKLGELFASLLLRQLKPRLGVGPDALRPIDRIAKLGCPVFIIGGEQDQHTTVEDTLALYGAAREPKRLWIVPGAAHVDFHRTARREYETRVLDFLDSATREPRSPSRRPGSRPTAPPAGTSPAPASGS